MKIDPYSQRRKCSAETLVCKNIRVVPIFMGSSLYMEHQMRVGSSKIAIFAFCGRYVFPNFIFETTMGGRVDLGYPAMQRPGVELMTTLSMYSPNGFSSTSKQMTLNDLEYPLRVKHCLPGFPGGIF